MGRREVCFQSVKGHDFQRITNRPAQSHYMGLHRSVGKALQRQRTPTHVKNSVREVSVIRNFNMAKDIFRSHFCHSSISSCFFCLLSLFLFCLLFVSSIFLSFYFKDFIITLRTIIGQLSN